MKRTRLPPRDGVPNRLLSLWFDDDPEFDDLLERWLEAGRDADLQRTLTGATGDAGLDLSETIARAAESVVLHGPDGPVLARLAAIPVLVADAAGGHCDTDRVAAALDSLGFGPRHGVVLAAADLYPAAAVAKLPLSARRAVVTAVAGGGAVPGLSPLRVADDGQRHQGVILAALVGPEEENPGGFLDEDLPLSNIRTFQRLALRAGGGVVDVAAPGPLGALLDAFDDARLWLVAAAAGADEVADYFAVAAREAGQARVGCGLCRLPDDRFQLRLFADDGRVLDDRCFDPWALPLTPADFVRAIEALASWVVEESARVPPTALAAAADQPRPPRPPVGRRRPAFTVVAGHAHGRTP